MIRNCALYGDRKINRVVPWLIFGIPPKSRFSEIIFQKKGHFKQGIIERNPLWPSKELRNPFLGGINNPNEIKQLKYLKGSLYFLVLCSLLHKLLPKFKIPEKPKNFEEQTSVYIIINLLSPQETKSLRAKNWSAISEVYFLPRLWWLYFFLPMGKNITFLGANWGTMQGIRTAKRRQRNF